MYYPIFADIAGKNCVVIGGGRKAERAVRLLLECEAKVTVISPKLTPTLLELSNYGRLIHAAREYHSGDLKGALLVLTFGSAEINEKVMREANRRGVLVSFEDDREQSNLILPAVIRRGELVIAISTGGNSPGLADKIKQDLQGEYGPEYREYVRLLADAEQRINEKYAHPEERYQALLRVMESNALELLSKGQRDLAEGSIKRCI